MTSHLSERLKTFIAALGFNYKDFAKDSDIPYPTVLDHVHGKVTPRSGILEKLTMRYHCNLTWLLTGEGEMFLTQAAGGVRENTGLYIKEGILKNICAMVLEMTEEEQRDLLKHIEDQQLLAEIRAERKKLKDAG
jgi:hypothetical protein